LSTAQWPSGPRNHIYVDPTLKGAERRTHPRSVVAVDAACDLPTDYMHNNAIVVLPMRVLGPTHDALDQRNAKETERFMNGPLTQQGDQFSVRAMGTRETQNFLLSNIEANRDNVFQLTSSAASTPVFSTCAHAATSLMALHKKARATTGYRTKFRMWVMDTRTMFAGEGVVAYAAISQINAGANSARLVDHLQSVRRATHTIVMPTNGRGPEDELDLEEIEKPFYSRWWRSMRGSQAPTHILLTREGRTHTLGESRSHRDAIDTIMRIAHSSLDSGLLVPVVNVSYAGDPTTIENRSDYQYLVERARIRKIDVLLSTMSVVGTSNMGAGSISLGFAPRKPFTN
jgi:fatty acid-binding protein DegV